MFSSSSTMGLIRRGVITSFKFLHGSLLERRWEGGNLRISGTTTCFPVLNIYRHSNNINMAAVGDS